MNSFQIAVLTPPGSAAIAVVAVRGPGAWNAIQRRFRLGNGKALNGPPSNRFRFGRFGDDVSDEVLLISHRDDCFEIHCHGGRRVVDWLIRLLKSDGGVEFAGVDTSIGRFVNWTATTAMQHARTVRTASILLDQAHGAYDRAVASGGSDELLRRNARVGRHLIEPWKVAIAGAPNAGKSTLLNTLAGFARSIVSPIPGTTRDAVSVSVAFDGWPVDLIDTAGLRESPDQLEGEGIQRARDAVRQSDLCLWIVDATGELPASIEEVATSLERSADSTLIVLNKCDLIAIPEDRLCNASRISAVTGDGVAELGARIAATLVPSPPGPGDPVPFTKEQCDRWSS